MGMKCEMDKGEGEWRGNILPRTRQKTMITFIFIRYFESNEMQAFR